MDSRSSTSHKPSGSSHKPKQHAKQQRLSQALKHNLKRRKQSPSRSTSNHEAG